MQIMLNPKMQRLLLMIAGLALLLSTSHRVSHQAKLYIYIGCVIVALLIHIIQSQTSSVRPLRKEDYPEFQRLGEDAFVSRFREQRQRYWLPPLAAIVGGITLLYVKQSQPHLFGHPEYVFLGALLMVVTGGWLGLLANRCPLCKELPPKFASGSYYFGSGPPNCFRCGVRLN